MRLPRSPPLPLISTMRPGSRLLTSRCFLSILKSPDGDEIRVSAVSVTTSIPPASSRMVMSSPFRLMMSPLTFAPWPAANAVAVTVVVGRTGVCAGRRVTKPAKSNTRGVAAASPRDGFRSSAFFSSVHISTSHLLQGFRRAARRRRRLLTSHGTMPSRVDAWNWTIGIWGADYGEVTARVIDATNVIAALSAFPQSAAH